jgi:hypothetical protein
VGRWFLEHVFIWVVELIQDTSVEGCFTAEVNGTILFYLRMTSVHLWNVMLDGNITWTVYE